MLLHIKGIHLRYNSWPKSEESAKKASDLMPSGYFEAEVKKSAKNPLKEELNEAFETFHTFYRSWNNYQTKFG